MWVFVEVISEGLIEVILTHYSDVSKGCLAFWIPNMWSYISSLHQLATEKENLQISLVLDVEVN